MKTSEKCRCFITSFRFLLLLTNTRLFVAGIPATRSDGRAALEILADNHSRLLVTKYGDDDGFLNSSHLRRLLRELRADPDAAEAPLSANVSSLIACFSKEPEPSCPSTLCLQPEWMVELASESGGRADAIDAVGLKLLSPTILKMATGNCNEATRSKDKVPLEKSIGYGILSVVAISLCSLGGAIVLPFMEKQFYKRMLTWMVGLAVGTLAGSGLLHLMPLTYNMTYDNTGQSWEYIFKASAIFGGCYLFFCLERLLKTWSDSRSEAAAPTVDSAAQFDAIQRSNGQNASAHGHSHGGVEAGEGIAPVAWMIIFGDGLHNFIDGLSIGAAFTESTLVGISVSLAVFFEELPHELGDLAILLNSGMQFKQALFYNFLSACSCFIGLALGLCLGDVTETGAKWIFALAAGMFLYLALTDMIPELNRQADELVLQGSPLWKVLLIQHSGVLFGFSIMIIMAIYGGDISFS